MVFFAVASGTVAGGTVAGGTVVGGTAASGTVVGGTVASGTTAATVQHYTFTYCYIQWLSITSLTCITVHIKQWPAMQPKRAIMPPPFPITAMATTVGNGNLIFWMKN